MEQVNSIETLKVSEYKINYYGKEFDIKPTNKVLCLFVGGGGYTYSDGYEGYSSFQLFQCDTFGKTLIHIGNSSTNISGDDVKTTYTLNGKTFDVVGFATTDLFSQIVKI